MRTRSTRIRTTTLLLAAAATALTTAATGGASADEIRFVWEADSGASHGAAVVSVSGKQRGDAFDASDSPQLVQFGFDDGQHEYFGLGGGPAFPIASSGTELDSGNVVVGVTSPTGGSSVALQMDGPTGSDAATTGAGAFTGRWVLADSRPVRASYVHRATTDNGAGTDVTWLSHPLLDDDPNRVFFVTHHYNPGPTSTQIFEKNLGVYYEPTAGRWSIFTQDSSAIAAQTSFNVLIPAASADLFVHVASAANISSNWTEIDHPALNGQPNAQILVTPNWDPPGPGIGYFDHPLGVWYDTITGRWNVFAQDLAAMPINAAFNIWIPEGGLANFVHAAELSNVIADETAIDLPEVTGVLDALPVFTPNWNPNGGSGTYSNYIMGVGLDTIDRWGLFREDGGAVTVGADFNVYFPAWESAAASHVSTAKNSLGSGSALDHAFLNGHPDRLLQATPIQVGPVPEPHEVGVHFSNDQWWAVNTDLATMHSGREFSVFAPPSARRSFVHKAEPGNKTGSWTYMNHPLLNDDPVALAFVTQAVSPHGTSGGTIYPVPVGVFHEPATGRWAILAQDAAPVPDDTAFHVYVAEAGARAWVHTALPANSSGSRTTLDHPLLNGNPDARALVTLLWDTSFEFGVYNNHPVALVYDAPAARWAISNQDGVAMPAGATFHVMVPEAVCADADFDGRCDVDDRCPFYAQSELDRDADSNGIGDECECGDQNGDGTVNLLDIFAINDAILGIVAASPLCDTNDDGACNLLDIFGVNDKILGAPAYCERWPAP